ncbi:hypothetical protein GXM_09265 [Nostoc sphaeroides CCNUC1]|uniref:Uncharacterized protein n=1 Tax=Nostoc sphaeroides CCNUC1 TaxID=2653204 RepID=A0A5P8WGQ0_9NOSO|nr:hypothetical protein GXM_09265 [Nostoc sphaeroides CCNUC1]
MARFLGYALESLIMAHFSQNQAIAPFEKEENREAMSTKSSPTHFNRDSQ